MGRSEAKKKSGAKKTPNPVELPSVGVAEGGGDVTSGNATPTQVSALGNSPESVLSNGVITTFKMSPPEGTEAINHVMSPQDVSMDQGSTSVIRDDGSPTSIPPSSFSESLNVNPGKGSTSPGTGLDSNHPTSFRSSSSVLSFSSTPPPSQVLSTPVKSVGVSSSCSNSSPLTSASDSELLSRDSAPQTDPLKSSPTSAFTGNSRNDSSVSLRRSNSERSPSRKTALSTKAILLSDLINSPRFYHPQEGQELSGCQFLYKDIMRSMVQSTVDLFHSRSFWNQLFISTVTVDRNNLGWNEMTSSLYTR